MRVKLPWQKSFRRLPDHLERKVRALSPGDIRVQCVQEVTAQQIASGRFAHLGFEFRDGKLHVPDLVIPDPSIGRMSAINMHGTQIVHRDRPKVTQTYDFESPNWGDWANGSHTVSWDRDVYQRTEVPPKEHALRIEVLGQDPRRDTFTLRFGVDAVLNLSHDDSASDLLFAVNLLQETTGKADLYASDAKLSDYLASLYVSWEILPPGEREANIARILSGTRPTDLKTRERVVDRYNFLASLNPKSLVQGTSGLRSYFGALFLDDLVVFENVEYGNAIYILFEEWETLSKLSRTELLKSHKDRIVRIAHEGDWKDRVRRLVRSRVRASRKANGSQYPWIR